MNRLSVIKVACVASVIVIALLELSFLVVPKAEALNVRSFDSPIKIDESSFPDASFRNFVATNIDADDDGYLTPKERDSVTDLETLSLANLGVSDVEGVESFPYLEKLDLRGNSLDEVDVSKNTKLKTLDLRGNKHSSGAQFSLLLPQSDETITVRVSSDSNISGDTDNVKIVKGD